jgi:hypothetical protein
MFTLNKVFADSRPTVADAGNGDVQTAFLTGKHIDALAACGRSQVAVVRLKPCPPATASSSAGVHHAQP